MSMMAAAPVCVYCRQQPSDPRWKPFCSERSQLSDLGRWLQGDYKVPGPPAEIEDGFDADNEGDDPP